MDPVLARHPLARIHLTALRDATTPSARFRWHLHRLAEILFWQASADLDTTVTRVQTPLAETEGSAFARPVVLVPILRAGLGLEEAVLPLVPDAVVAHLGIARDETTAQPVSYYAKLPPVLAEADIFLLDPMLATGGSAVCALNQLKAAGARRLRFICVVSCPEGLAAVTAAHPEVPIFTAAIDAGLNEHFYIVPGLGDAGDRCFQT